MLQSSPGLQHLSQDLPRIPNKDCFGSIRLPLEMQRITSAVYQILYNLRTTDSMPSEHVQRLSLSVESLLLFWKRTRTVASSMNVQSAMSRDTITVTEQRFQIRIQSVGCRSDTIYKWNPQSVRLGVVVSWANRDQSISIWRENAN